MEGWENVKWFTSVNRLLADVYLQRQENEGHAVCPPNNLRYRAFELTPMDEVKVVILGQDPYTDPGKACGLSFGVPNGVKIPPTLANIYKELESDVNRHPVSNELTDWAKGGVLLLNTSLSVVSGESGNNKTVKWDTLINEVFTALMNKPIVVLLWGNHAKKYRHACSHKHHILTAAHPSPLSAYRGFFGCKHFSKTNYLLRHVIRTTPIKWGKCISSNSSIQA